MPLAFTSVLRGRDRYLIALLVVLMLSSCMADKANKKIYISDCNAEQTFKQVTFVHLLDSLAYYDRQYIEVTGVYREGKGSWSALYDNGTIVANNKKALWVNFNQECELYLVGTHTGLFDFNNGRFTQMNNKQLRLRGQIDTNNHGKLRQYKGCIDKVSLVEW